MAELEIQGDKKKIAETEQKIRHILEKYIGSDALTLNREEDFWQKFPYISRYGSEPQQEFSKEISDVFHTTLTVVQWEEDAVTIGDLAEILATGKLGADKKKKNLEENLAMERRSIKIASIGLLPFFVVFVLGGKMGPAMALGGFLLIMQFCNFLISRQQSKNALPVKSKESV